MGQTAAEKKAAALAAQQSLGSGITTKISDKVPANLPMNMNDCPIGPVKFLTYNDKSDTTGIWQKIQLENGETAIVETGKLRELHNSGRCLIFVTAKVEAGDIVEFRNDVKLGIKDHQLAA